MGKKYYYKAMDKDMKCYNNFQFKVGETYAIESEELELCTEKVFHFCEKIEDTRGGYYNSSTDRHFLIEVLGNIVTESENSGSNKIRIVREISGDEIVEHIENKETLMAKIFLALYTSNISLIKGFSKSENEDIRSAVAENFNTPVYILEKLVKDKSFIVRKRLVENLNVSLYMLEELAKDKSWFVRRNVAKNPNTPVYILEELLKDLIPEVRKQAQERLKEITQ